MPKNLSLGWIRDLPDHRDHLYSAPLAHLQKLPPQVDLRPKLSQAPYDQERIGSCTANAIAGAIQFDRQGANQNPDFVPSRLFIYFNERAMEHTIPVDAGAQLRDGIKSVAKLGVCPESQWPYDGTPADPNTHLFPPSSSAVERPSPACYTDAAKYRVISYSRIAQSLAQMKGCLAAGFPFVFGFAVYDSLYDSDGKPRTVIPMPGQADSQIGGHAVLAMGYDDERNVLIVRNSWGPAAQDNGHFYLPYAYVTDPSLAGDFWTVRAVAD
jgi:C1A family cysteine protease